MRKSALHRIILYSAMFLMTLLAVMSCTKDETITLQDKSGNLSLLPKLFDDGIDYLRGRTKAQTKAKEDTDPSIVEGDDVNAHPELHETLIETLDLFIKRDAADENSHWIYEKHFDKDSIGALLNQNTPGGLLEKAKHLINSNWVNEHTTEGEFVPGVQYHIYVTANNPHTHSCNHTEHQHYKGVTSTVPTTLAQLKALYTSDAETYCYYTPDEIPAGTNRVNTKSFLMDGDIVWTPKPELGEQVWDVDLKRAVSKVVVNLSMDDDFKDELQHEPDGVGGYLDGYWDPGAPMWRYVNFSFDVADIASGTYVQDLNNLKTGSMLVTDGDWDTYQYLIRTYTAPFKWTDYTNTPYILMSIYYTYKSDDVEVQKAIIQKYGSLIRRRWYHIPICDEVNIKDVGLQRNNIYIVDASVASWGSENDEVEGEDMPLRIEYHIVPWTEKNVSNESTVVKLGAIKYLTVYPMEYILKGDGDQRVDLNWFASISLDDGDFVDIDENSLSVSYVNYQGNTVDIKGSSVVKTPAESELDGRSDIEITSTAPTSTANGETVKITITPDGLITVVSDALDSRAIKNIEFDVKLRNSSLTKHIKIRHFPLDNIQSITGSWSSRWNKGTETKTVREYSFNPTADGWTSSDGSSIVECTLSDFNRASADKSTQTSQEATGTPSNYDSASEIESGGNGSSMQTSFRNAVPQNERQGANSEANSYNNGDYWYWGTGSETFDPGWFGDYDWRISNGGWNNYTYYRYLTYNRRIYYKNVTHYYARRYYRDVQVQVPATGSWVDWDRDNGMTYSASTAKYTSDDNYQAKVYNDSDGKIYGIDVSRNYTYTRATSQDAGGWYQYTTSGTRTQSNSIMTSLTNNHMYVIQVTSISNEYVIGRPVLDGNNQSQDKVVSPAFMIASQLGATVSFANGNVAADHCSSYMEVGTDGTRYTGWRLPTAQEIDFIINYQRTDNPAYNITLTPVLTGYGYWALNGTQQYTTYTDGGSQRVRCVRDLSLAEIDKLNNGE